MPNKVSVEITAEDKTEPAFAKATAEAKAFSSIMRETGRTEVKSNTVSAEAIGAHERALRLLRDAEVAESLTMERSAGIHQRLSGVFSALARGIDGGGSGRGGVVGSLFGAAGAAEQAGTALGTVGTMIVPLIGLAATLAIALTPFIAGLVVATAGVAGFAAIAVPEISKVIAARQALTKAEQQYNLATTPAQRASALKAEAAATAGLTSQQKALMGPLGQLGHMFGRLEKAVNPSIMTAFGTGIKIIKDLLPALRPLLISAGQALDGFLKNIDHWLKSPGGQKFIHWLSVEGPMAMKTFGRDLWIVTRDVSDVFHFLYDTGLTFDRHWRVFWHDMAKVVDGFRTGFTQMGHLIESIWNSTVGTVISTGARLTAWFQALPGRIVGFLAGLPAMLFAAGQHAIQGLINGLGSELGALGSMAASIASKVAGFFGLSPAREGPLSGGGAPFIRGQHFAADFAAGMGSGRGLLGAAAGNLAGAARVPGGYGPGSGTAGLTIEFHLPSGALMLSPEFWVALGNGIRVRGGSKDILTKKVVFA